MSRLMPCATLWMSVQQQRNAKCTWVKNMCTCERCFLFVFSDLFILFYFLVVSWFLFLGFVFFVEKTKTKKKTDKGSYEIKIKCP